MSNVATKTFLFDQRDTYLDNINNREDKTKSLKEIQDRVLDYLENIEYIPFDNMDLVCLYKDDFASVTTIRDTDRERPTFKFDKKITVTYFKYYSGRTIIGESMIFYVAIKKLPRIFIDMEWDLFDKDDELIREEDTDRYIETERLFNLYIKDLLDVQPDAKRNYRQFCDRTDNYSKDHNDGEPCPKFSYKIGAPMCIVNITPRNIVSHYEDGSYCMHMSRIMKMFYSDSEILTLISSRHMEYRKGSDGTRMEATASSKVIKVPKKKYHYVYDSMSYDDGLKEIKTKAPHDRRGHWRTYKSGKKVWVRATVVNGGTDKLYDCTDL